MEGITAAGRQADGTFDLRLADFIDIRSIQSLMDDFHSVVRLPLGINDMQGQVLAGVGWQAICTRFHRVHHEARRSCRESDTELTRGIPPGEIRLYRCKNQMLDFATPIVIDGQCLGYVFSGQFFFTEEPPDRELFRAQAKRFGFAEDEYLAALDAVPRLDRETVQAAMRFFMNLAGIISSLSYANLRLAQSLAEREALTASLREREELFHSVCEGTGDAIFVKDCQSRWQMANAAVLRVLEKKLEEVLGHDDRQIYGDDAIALPLMAADRRIIESKRTEVVEETIKTPDGLRIFLSTKSPRLAADGTVIGIIGIARDITERKRAEEEVRAAKVAAEEANRAKGEFLANMSHEIRTPMTIFMSAVEHLLHIDDDPFRRELLTMAEQSSQRLHLLIDDLLDFSRIEARRMNIEEHEFDLRACLAETVTMLAGQAREKALRLASAVAADVPATVVGDAHRLGQVLLNLVGNAIKFTPAGEVGISVRTCGDFLEFAVRDTGIGIPEGKIHLLFQSFSQVDGSLTRQFGGTGLGLAISKGLVELMGGQIWVASRLGEGSVFTFTLPLKKAAEAENKIPAAG
jgi:PAS domain S-box-containing protein